MEKSVSAFLNGPTEKWFPAYEVSRNKLHKAHCFDRLVDLVKAKKSYFKKKTNSMAFISTPDMEYWTNSSGI